MIVIILHVIIYNGVIQKIFKGITPQKTASLHEYAGYERLKRVMTDQLLAIKKTT
jgi:hypothetical protein